MFVSEIMSQYLLEEKTKNETATYAHVVYVRFLAQFLILLCIFLCFCSCKKITKPSTNIKKKLPMWVKGWMSYIGWWEIAMFLKTERKYLIFI